MRIVFRYSYDIYTFKSQHHILCSAIKAGLWEVDHPREIDNLKKFLNDGYINTIESIYNI